MKVSNKKSNVRISNFSLEIKKNIFVNNYIELYAKLNQIKDKEFLELKLKDKIINWIKENFEDNLLVTKLIMVNSRKKFIKEINQRINDLIEENSYLHNEKHSYPIIELKPQITTILIFIFAIIIIQLFLFQYVYDKEVQTSSELSNLKSEYLTLQQRNNILQETKDFIESENIALRRQIDLKYSEVIILPKEKAASAPPNRINTNDIIIDDEKIVFELDDAYLAKFKATGSMLPVLDSNSTAIQIVPNNETDIRLGDIISYTSDENRVIIHRVIEIGTDEQGWFAKTKGDNNLKEDLQKVRFKQITRILVAIIY